MNVEFFVSEQALVEADPKAYGPRREALRKSRAFARTWEREAEEIFKILTNAYKDEKPPVAAE